MSSSFQTTLTGLKQTWEIGRFSMVTVCGKAGGKKITTEYEKLLSLLCNTVKEVEVIEFPKTKWWI